MDDSNKSNLKDKLRLALSSTERAIYGDFIKSKKINQNEKTINSNSFDFENLKSKADFIKARAESDSFALKKKFSNDLIYKKNLPQNSSCKALYAIAEKIRYEALG